MESYMSKGECYGLNCVLLSKFIWRSNSHNLRTGLSFLQIRSFFNWGVAALPCCVGFCYTTMWISYMYTHILSLLNFHPTPLGHHRALSWAPCTIQQVPTSYLFYTWWCIYVNPNLLIHPTLSHPHVHSSVLCKSAFYYWAYTLRKP